MKDNPNIAFNNDLFKFNDDTVLSQNGVDIKGDKKRWFNKNFIGEKISPEKFRENLDFLRKKINPKTVFIVMKPTTAPALKNLCEGKTTNAISAIFSDYSRLLKLNKVIDEFAAANKNVIVWDTQKFVYEPQHCVDMINHWTPEVKVKLSEYLAELIADNAAKNNKKKLTLGTSKETILISSNNQSAVFNEIGLRALGVNVKDVFALNPTRTTVKNFADYKYSQTDLLLFDVDKYCVADVINANELKPINDYVFIDKSDSTIQVKNENDYQVSLIIARNYINEKKYDKAIEYFSQSGSAGKKELITALFTRKKEGDEKRAFEIAQSMLNDGTGLLPMAQLLLARMYRDGKGTKQNLELALSYMRKVAYKNEQSTRVSRNELAELLILIGTERDLAEAFEVAYSFAEQGDGRAMFCLGKMYYDGLGVEKDVDKAHTWMRKASNDSLWRIELIDSMLKYLNKDIHREAFNMCLKEALAEEDARYMGRLGRMYRDGIGVEKDNSKAVVWIRKAADKNAVWMIELIDLLLASYNEDFWEEAYKKCLTLVNQGDPRAMGRLGRMYRDGKGVTKDIKKAKEWIGKTAEKLDAWKNEYSKLCQMR